MFVSKSVALREVQINAPFQLTVEDIKLRMSICKEKCDYFQKHGQRHRRQHLTNCIEAVQDQADKTAERNILAIIKREKDKAFWRRLNYALGKHVRGQNVRAVQVEDGAGGVVDVNTEEAVARYLLPTLPNRGDRDSHVDPFHLL